MKWNIPDHGVLQAMYERPNEQLVRAEINFAVEEEDEPRVGRERRERRRRPIDRRLNARERAVAAHNALAVSIRVAQGGVAEDGVHQTAHGMGNRAERSRLTPAAELVYRRHSPVPGDRAIAQTTRAVVLEISPAIVSRRERHPLHVDRRRDPL